MTFFCCLFSIYQDLSVASIVAFLNNAVLRKDAKQYVCAVCHVDEIGCKVDQFNYHNDNIYCYVTIVNLSILKFNVRSLLSRHPMGGSACIGHLFSIYNICYELKLTMYIILFLSAESLLACWWEDKTSTNNSTH